MWSCEYAHTFGAYIPVRVICACICVVSTHTLVLRHLCVVCVTTGSHVHISEYTGTCSVCVFMKHTHTHSFNVSASVV